MRVPEYRINEMTKVGKRIRDLRTEKGITQKQLSQELTDNSGAYIFQSALSKFEHGQTDLLKAEDVFHLALYFGVSADYLLGLSPAHNPRSDYQTIAKCTGLTDESIRKLNDCMDLGGESRKTADVINILLTTKTGGKILKTIREILFDDFPDQYIETSTNISDEPNTEIGKSTEMTADDYHDLLSARIIRLLSSLKSEME